MTTPEMDDDAIDQLARAAFDAFYVEGTPYTDVERGIFRDVAKAVLAEANLLTAAKSTSPN